MPKNACVIFNLLNKKMAYAVTFIVNYLIIKDLLCDGLHFEPSPYRHFLPKLGILLTILITFEAFEVTERIVVCHSLPSLN